MMTKQIKEGTLYAKHKISGKKDPKMMEVISIYKKRKRKIVLFQKYHGDKGYARTTLTAFAKWAERAVG